MHHTKRIKVIHVERDESLIHRHLNEWRSFGAQPELFLSHSIALSSSLSQTPLVSSSNHTTTSTLPISTLSANAEIAKTHEVNMTSNGVDALPSTSVEAGSSSSIPEMFDIIRSISSSHGTLSKSFRDLGSNEPTVKQVASTDSPIKIVNKTKKQNSASHEKGTSESQPLDRLFGINLNLSKPDTKSLPISNINKQRKIDNNLGKKKTCFIVPPVDNSEKKVSVAHSVTPLIDHTEDSISHSVENECTASTLPNSSDEPVYFPISDQSHKLEVVVQLVSTIEDLTLLIEELESELNNPMRIQAVTLYVGFWMSSGQNNFSDSLNNSAEKDHADIFHPCLFYKQVQGFVVYWDSNELFSMPSEIGFQLLAQVAKKLKDIFVVSYNTPLLLIALLGYERMLMSSSETKKVGDVFTSGAYFLLPRLVMDVHLMSWMLDPSHPIPDYLTLVEMHASSDGLTRQKKEYIIRESNSQVITSIKYYGKNSSNQKQSLPCLSQVAQSVDSDVPSNLVHFIRKLSSLYRQMYGLMGSFGLLPVFLQYESHIAAPIAWMRFNGISVDVKKMLSFNLSCKEAIAQFDKQLGGIFPNEKDINFFSLALRQKIVDSISNNPGSEGIASDTCLNSLTELAKISRSQSTNDLKNHHCKDINNVNAEMDSSLHCTLEDMLKKFDSLQSQIKLFSLFSSDNIHLFPDLDRVKTVNDEMMKSSKDDMEFLMIPDKMNLLANLSTDVSHKRMYVDFALENYPVGRITSYDRSLGFLKDLENEANRQLLECFVASSSHEVLLVFVYEQLELRILAHLAQEPELIQSFIDGKDILRVISLNLFLKSNVQDILPEELEMTQRVIENFIQVPSDNTSTLHRDDSSNSVWQLHRRFLKAYPKIASFREKVISEGYQNNSVRTLLGRIQPIPDLMNADLRVRETAKQAAFNNIIDGSVADIYKCVLNKLWDCISSRFFSTDIYHQPKLLLHSCEKFVFSLSLEDLASTVSLLHDVMISSTSFLTVPLQIFTLLGPSLADLTPWSIDHTLGIRGQSAAPSSQND